MAADFALTTLIRIGLALLASAGTLYILGRNVQARLSRLQLAIIGLTVATAAVHMLSGARDYLLYANGVGYLVLLLALYFIPLGPLAAQWRGLYGLLGTYAGVTIVAYFVVHPGLLRGEGFDSLALFTKGVELLLLLGLLLDYRRGERPVPPAVETPEHHHSPLESRYENGAQFKGPALDVRGLKYSYPDKPGVLQDITFTIQPRERVGLIGPNGAGKTTLFMSLVGIQRPEAGEIILFERPMNHRDFRPEIGMVFQKSDDQLFNPSVQDDVAFGPQNLGLSPAEVEQRVAEALTTTGTAHLAERPPHHLSGGEKRMVSIAGVMAMRPQLVIYDEPSANLDLRARRRLIEFLQQSRHAFIVCSHDLEFLLEVCDRVMLLDDGQIVADGAPTEIMGDEALMVAHGLEQPHSLTPHAAPIEVT